MVQVAAIESHEWRAGGGGGGGVLANQVATSSRETSLGLGPGDLACALGFAAAALGALASLGATKSSTGLRRSPIFVNGWVTGWEGSTTTVGWGGRDFSARAS
jgi:hypothetical protein